MNGVLLDREYIRGLIHASPPLVASYLDLDRQLQPNGFDLTLRDISTPVSQGAIGPHPEDRVISQAEALHPGDQGAFELAPGSYLVTFNEIVNLPVHLAALGRPRSSLLRSGVAIHTAVWDAGYRGRSQALLVVHNPLGYHIIPDASIMQMVFFMLTAPVTQGYQGIYQGENTSPSRP